MHRRRQNAQTTGRRRPEIVLCEFRDGAVSRLCQFGHFGALCPNPGCSPGGENMRKRLCFESAADFLAAAQNTEMSRNGKHAKRRNATCMQKATFAIGEFEGPEGLSLVTKQATRCGAPGAPCLIARLGPSNRVRVADVTRSSGLHANQKGKFQTGNVLRSAPPWSKSSPT